MKLETKAPGIFIITEFWTSDQCQQFINRSENMGYEPAQVQTDKGQQRVEEARNNQRILFTDQKLADHLWELLKSQFPL